MSFYKQSEEGVRPQEIRESRADAEAKEPPALAEAIRYFRQGRRAQAFLLLSKPGLQGFPAAVFALGLCHLSAGERPSAISCFERALRLLQPLSGSLPDPLENGDAYLKLSETQILEKTYLVPMDSVFCGHFPVAAKQTVLLALIHAHMENGTRDQAKRLLPGLAGPVFETFKQQLSQEQL